MTALVAADLLKLRRRRGLWLTALLLPAVLMTVIFLLSATEVIETDGGHTFVKDGAAALAFLGPILAVLIGARVGSDEHAAGTLRYQLLTGVPRERLYLSKLAALAVACLLLTLTGAAAVLVFGIVLPPAPGDGLEAMDVVDAVWNPLLPTFAYGAIAFGVGSLMRSTGPAIAVALVLNLVGLDMLTLLVLIDDWFRHLVLDVGIDRLTLNAIDDPEDRVSVVAGAIITILWTGGFVLAGWLRLRRLEV
ncbi:MAG TPA: ABC transporter permease subunit [Baekduia sp.]|nr:ABC transporter permease subunit [Baekduia sp.]